MDTEGARMPAPWRTLQSLLILFLVVRIVIVIIVVQVRLFAGLGFFIFVVVIVIFVRDEVEMYRMRLRNFELRFAFGATQDLAFFDLVLVDIDFGGTFRAADHDFILRSVFRGRGLQRCDRHLAAYYIPHDMKSTPTHNLAGQKGTRRKEPSSR